MGNQTCNIYDPRPVSIARTLPQIADHRPFQLKPEDGTSWDQFGHRPGQFVEVSLFGKGEAPISISSPPTRPEALEICVRRAGKLTRDLRRLTAAGPPQSRKIFFSLHALIISSGHTLAWTSPI